MKMNKKIKSLIALGLVGGFATSSSFADETPVATTTVEAQETKEDVIKVDKPVSETKVEDVKSRIKPEDIKKEVIAQHGKFDFSDNIKTANVKKIEVISQPDPGVLGTYKAEVKVIFNDDKETTVQIETIVVENETEVKKILGETVATESFQDHVKAMVVAINMVQGDTVDYAKGLAKYDPSWKIDVIKSIDTSTYGDKTARIKVTNLKGEVAEVDILVKVIEKKTEINKEDQKVKVEDQKKDDVTKVKVTEPVKVEANNQANVAKGEPIKGEIVKTGDAANIGFGLTSILGGLGLGANHLRKRRK